ncbi:MAG: methylmalonyl-CoA epimerase [Flavobacteriales bacterium]
MNRIEHIGIAVKSLQVSIPIYEKLLKTTCYKTEEVESEGVRTAFFKVGESKIELLEATRPDSPIAKFIEKKGEGIHHIAFDVNNVQLTLNDLKSSGFDLINDAPKEGADGKIIAFIHPKSTPGLLAEVCQDKLK